MSTYIKHKLSDAITSAVTSNGETLAQQLTDTACKQIADKIPDMINRITDGVLAKLNEKIDSNEFSEKFVNVLQQKLLDEKTTSEPFLSKFSIMFDKIIEKAMADYEKSKVVPNEVSAEVATPAEVQPVPTAETSETAPTTTEQQVVTGGRNRKTRKNMRKSSHGKNKRKTRMLLK
jgi:hypothetical protein